jgi:hypothetical protein
MMKETWNWVPGKTEVDCARGSDDGTVFALLKNTKIFTY